MTGRSVFENTALMNEAYLALCSCGATENPRLGSQVLAGLEMALWDAAGKLCGCPVHSLLGGKLRDSISFFGFVQGSSAAEAAADAARLQAEGHEVLYLKLHGHDAKDLETVRAVRQAIGPAQRLRLDPNCAWDGMQASRMIQAIEKLGPIDFLEQPCTSSSFQALKRIKAAHPQVPIAADQSVFTPFDVLQIVERGAADVVVIGLHEAGGISQFRKAAAVAEAGGISVCIHGVYETGITCCASMQAAATIPNLADGNQYMLELLEYDLVLQPKLGKRLGHVDVPKDPGLGFSLDTEAVTRAEEMYEEHVASLDDAEHYLLSVALLSLDGDVNLKHSERTDVLKTWA
eukprot:CAMPEP_0117512128 /NCGR_PEP_ID=MMETSP0784-20121206/28872_1 /TAXON_ID=39447 /ORGANISM="" /LENGTH=346 /DNA_ID=CAMNT_0005307839 /DNA_START=451 /DNA_END=1491 /DNA_ORIENTATION=+